MSWKYLARLLPALVLLMPCCGPKGPAMATVSGVVTFDGQPVEDGEILFSPLDKNLGPEAGRIKNGAFNFPAKVGQSRIEVRASRAVPGRDTPMGPITLEYIPARYNEESTLSENVTADGKNHWELKLVGDK